MRDAYKMFNMIKLITQHKNLLSDFLLFFNKNLTFLTKNVAIFHSVAKFAFFELLHFFLEWHTYMTLKTTSLAAFTYSSFLILLRFEIPQHDHIQGRTLTSARNFLALLELKNVKLASNIVSIRYIYAYISKKQSLSS